MVSKHDVLCLLVSMFLALLISLYPSHAVFVSIDCGSKASASYTDESSIKWTGDDGYVQNGESKEVSFILIPPYVSGTVMSTLRAFPTLRKNCYTINVDKGEKVLARASFFYGNYDGLDSPPTFELQFDGNFWATVNTSNYNVRSYYEAIYVTKANTTSICVAQTLPGQIPFISALELRSLNSSMYSLVDPHHALFMAYRSNSGSNITIRYPDDVFDRIWEAETSFLYTENVKSEVVSIDASEAEDKPPQAVLQKALVGDLWGFLRTIIYLRTEHLPSVSVPVYITAYFSEVAHLNATDKRSIDVYINNDPYSTRINPPFGSVSVVYIANKTASSNTNISIRGSTDSTLPPLLNAYEVYNVGDVLTDGTNGDDVNGLVALQKQFDKLQIWSGDPCLPSKFSWEWLECNTNPFPHVTELNLSSYGLFGTLPDFSSMTALETIDLHNNNLYGPIPDFLGSMPNLKFLNLADNRFNGTIPNSLSHNKNLVIIVTGNCLASMPCKPEVPSLPSSGPSNMPEAPPLPTSGPSNMPEAPVLPSSGPKNMPRAPSLPTSGPSNMPRTPSLPSRGPSNIPEAPSLSSSGLSNMPEAPSLPSNGPSNMPENPSSAGLDINTPQGQTAPNLSSGGKKTQKQVLALIFIFPISLLFLLQMNF